MAGGTAPTGRTDAPDRIATAGGIDAAGPIATAATIPGPGDIGGCGDPSLPLVVITPGDPV